MGSLLHAAQVAMRGRVYVIWVQRMRRPVTRRWQNGRALAALGWGMRVQVRYGGRGVGRVWGCTLVWACSGVGECRLGVAGLVVAGICG